MICEDDFVVISLTKMTHVISMKKKTKFKFVRKMRARRTSQFPLLQYLIHCGKKVLCVVIK